MADDTILSAKIGTGDTIHTDELTDTSYKMATSKIIFGVSGVNDAYWAAGAGAAVGSDVGRVTLASDDPAVAALQLIDNAVSGAGFNITQLGGASVPIGAGTEAAAVRVTLPTDGTGAVTANLSATDNAVLGAIAASVAGTLTVGAHAVTNAGTFAVQATLAAETTKVIGTINVSAAQTIAVTNAGTFATQATLQTGSATIGKLAANSGVDIGDVDVTSLPNVTIGTWSAGTLTVDLGANNDVQGDIAHDTADSGNPVKVGAKVETATSGATLAADGDRTDLYADADGTLIQRVNHPLADLLTERVSDTAGTSAAFTGDFAASGASVKNYVTAMSIHNSSATDGYVDFRDGAAGAVLWTVPIPAGGGLVVSNSGHPLFGTSANTALAYDVSAALSTVYISVSGFKSKV